ncbi:MAG: DUF928 domain-containing protein [Snowella sp.]|nr:DUF928 domain-containing protein [Snowella sp.]
MMSRSIGIFTLILGILIPVESVLSQALPNLVSLQFPKAADRGAPVATSGAGTRGENCLLNGEQLVALVPSSETSTVSANPTFYVYAPESQGKTGDFVLVDAKGNDVYVTSLTLPNQSSIIEITLPQNIALQVGQTYQWQFSIVCNINGQEASNFTHAKIKRTELTPTQQKHLNQAENSLDQAKIYAQANIWQDTLMMAAKARTTHPREWQELLQSVGLERVSSAPLITAKSVINSTP